MGEVKFADRLLRVYMAGKVGADGGYRGQMLGFNPMALEGATRIIGQEDAEMLYVGPFSLPSLAPEYPEQFRQEGSHGLVRNASNHHLIDGEAAAVVRCLHQIEECDVVFAWIDSADCFGTISEIGFASAWRKDIILQRPYSRFDPAYFPPHPGEFIPCTEPVIDAFSDSDELVAPPSLEDQQRAYQKRLVTFNENLAKWQGCWFEEGIEWDYDDLWFVSNLPGVRLQYKDRPQLPSYLFYKQDLKTMPYADYLQTEHWQSKRREALDYYGATCCLCNSDLSLNVHHRTYERRGEELMSDLSVLCRDCHSRFHGK